MSGFVQFANKALVNVGDVPRTAYAIKWQSPAKKPHYKGRFVWIVLKYEEGYIYEFPVPAIWTGTAFQIDNRHMPDTIMYQVPVEDVLAWADIQPAHQLKVPYKFIERTHTVTTDNRWNRPQVV